MRILDLGLILTQSSSAHHAGCDLRSTACRELRSDYYLFLGSLCHAHRRFAAVCATLIGHLASFIILLFLSLSLSSPLPHSPPPQPACFVWQFSAASPGGGCWVGFPGPKRTATGWTGAMYAGAAPPAPPPAPPTHTGDTALTMPMHPAAAGAAYDDSGWRILGLGLMLTGSRMHPCSSSRPHAG